MKHVKITVLDLIIDKRIEGTYTSLLDKLVFIKVVQEANKTVFTISSKCHIDYIKDCSKKNKSTVNTLSLPIELVSLNNKLTKMSEEDYYLYTGITECTTFERHHSVVTTETHTKFKTDDVLYKRISSIMGAFTPDGKYNIHMNNIVVGTLVLNKDKCRFDTISRISFLTKAAAINIDNSHGIDVKYSVKS